jgi:hypothetical protein
LILNQSVKTPPVLWAPHSIRWPAKLKIQNILLVIKNLESCLKIRLPDFWLCICFAHYMLHECSFHGCKGKGALANVYVKITLSYGRNPQKDC